MKTQNCAYALSCWTPSSSIKYLLQEVRMGVYLVIFPTLTLRKNYVYSAAHTTKIWRDASNNLFLSQANGTPGSTSAVWHWPACHKQRYLLCQTYSVSVADQGEGRTPTRPVAMSTLMGPQSSQRWQFAFQSCSPRLMLQKQNKVFCNIDVCNCKTSESYFTFIQWKAGYEVSN